MNKSRYWAFIVYPESVIENWKDKLIEIGCMFAVSPLHDKDTNPDGTLKKAHYHIILQFEGPTTYKNVKENICDLVKGTIPQKIISNRGYYRYLCHLDNPEKEQYKVEEIEKYNGYEIDLTTSEIVLIKSKIIEDIEKYNYVEYCDLIDHYNNTGEYENLEMSMNNAYFFNQYITSRRNKLKKLLTTNNII